MDMTLEQRAELIAKVAHKAINQKRKYSGNDYIVHPKEVVGILKDNGITDPVILSAAWLHDVVEDTSITLDLIEWNVSGAVSQVVEMVTDISKPEDGNREARKKIDREHYKTADSRGKTVKLADCLANGMDIKENDPDFAIIYFKEIKKLLEYLKGGHKTLYLKLEKLINDFENQRNKDKELAASVINSLKLGKIDPKYDIAYFKEIDKLLDRLKKTNKKLYLELNRELIIYN